MSHPPECQRDGGQRIEHLIFYHLNFIWSHGEKMEARGGGGGVMHACE